MFNDILLVFVLSESQNPNNAGCVDRPVEGELEPARFRVEGKSSWPEEGVAETLKKLTERDVAGEAVSSFEDADNS